MLFRSLYAFFTENTVQGRRIYAVGGNEKAAKDAAWGLETPLVLASNCGWCLKDVAAGVIALEPPDAPAESPVKPAAPAQAKGREA